MAGTPLAGQQLVLPPPVGATCRLDGEVCFKDPLIRSLLATRPMRRLKEIGFLGAIGYIRRGNGRSPYHRRHNRLEHSVGVTHLADIYARSVELPERHRLPLLAAALLHDVGHGPLSHTLEPVFAEEYGVNHHLEARRIIAGDTAVGREIHDILVGAGIDVEEVLALIDGKHDGPFGFLFSGQINLDTLEGITRSRDFFVPTSSCHSARFTVRKWALNRCMPRAEFDSFWELKNVIYSLFIGAAQGAALDAIAQAYMRSNLALFSREDFSLTEKMFRQRHRPLFLLLDKASGPWTVLREQVPRSWMDKEIPMKSRSFFVCSDVRLDNHASINERYRQTKQIKTKPLVELLSQVR